MRVSFIIPHKGREELLKRTIQSIVDLDFDLQKIKIIVVTQNATLECAQFTQNGVHVNVIFRPESDTISALRNTGVEQSSSEYLVFLDADIHLSRNWLNCMFEELQAKPDRVLVSAVQRCAPEAGIIEKIWVTLNGSGADQAALFFNGRNLFMKRCVFQEAGGFPEHLTTCEDYYFTNKVSRLGEMYFTSQTSYIHLGEDKNYAELFRKEIWRGQSNLRSLTGRKLVLREIPSILIPLWQALFALIAVIATGVGHLLIAGLAVFLFCVPIALYTLRLYTLGEKHIRFPDALKFYSVYFPARILGTTLGVFKVIKM